MPTPARQPDHLLPFLEDRGLSVRARIFAAAAMGLALLVLLVGLEVSQLFPTRGILLLTVGASLALGLAALSFVIVGEQQDRWRRATLARTWAAERYGLILTQDEALEIFCRTDGRTEVRPQRVGAYLIYGASTAQHHPAGVQLVYEPRRGYLLHDLVTGQALPEID